MPEAFDACALCGVLESRLGIRAPSLDVLIIITELLILIRCA